MSGSIVSKLIVVALVTFQQEAAREAMIYVENDMIAARAAVLAAPETGPSLDADMWFQASADAYMPLIRAYLNEKVIFGELHATFHSARWWSLTLNSNPAAALSEIDGRYDAWNLAAWPNSLNPLKSDYRIALVEAMFEVYLATTARVDQIRAEISGFMPVPLLDLRFPAHTDPAWIKDPAIRAEYQARLDELARQQLVKQELKRTVGAVSGLAHGSGRAMKILYDGATGDELQALARLISGRDWTRNDLYRKIVEDWPELQSLVADARREP